MFHVDYRVKTRTLLPQHEGRGTDALMKTLKALQFVCLRGAGDTVEDICVIDRHILMSDHLDYFLSSTSSDNRCD